MIRGQKVLLDSDLPALYEVETRVLNQAVKRNLERFPEDFMFRLTRRESEALTSQLVISNAAGRGGRRHIPYASTEHLIKAPEDEPRRRIGFPTSELETH